MTRVLEEHMQRELPFTCVHKKCRHSVILEVPKDPSLRNCHQTIDVILKTHKEDYKYLIDRMQTCMISKYQVFTFHKCGLVDLYCNGYKQLTW